MFSVRVAKSADAKKIARIHVSRWRVNDRGQVSDAIKGVKRREVFWRQRLEQGTGKVFVIESDEIVGFCHLIAASDKDTAPKTIAEISAVYVLTDFWRIGAGRVLGCHVLAQARKQGYEAVTLWAPASNSNAMRFYESLGFTRDGAAKIETALDGGTVHKIRYRIKFNRANPGVGGLNQIKT